MGPTMRTLRDFLVMAILMVSFVLWSYPIIQKEVNATHKSLGR